MASGRHASNFVTEYNKCYRWVKNLQAPPIPGICESRNGAGAPVQSKSRRRSRSNLTSRNNPLVLQLSSNPCSDDNDSEYDDNDEFILVGPGQHEKLSSRTVPYRMGRKRHPSASSASSKRVTEDDTDDAPDQLTAELEVEARSKAREMLSRSSQYNTPRESMNRSREDRKESSLERHPPSDEIERQESGRRYDRSIYQDSSDRNRVQLKTGNKLSENGGRARFSDSDNDRQVTYKTRSDNSDRALKTQKIYREDDTGDRGYDGQVSYRSLQEKDDLASKTLKLKKQLAQRRTFQVDKQEDNSRVGLSRSKSLRVQRSPAMGDESDAPDNYAKKYQLKMGPSRGPPEHRQSEYQQSYREGCLSSRQSSVGGPLVDVKTEEGLIPGSARDRHVPRDATEYNRCYVTPREQLSWSHKNKTDDLERNLALLSTRSDSATKRPSDEQQSRSQKNSARFGHEIHSNPKQTTSRQSSERCPDTLCDDEWLQEVNRLRSLASLYKSRSVSSHIWWSEDSSADSKDKPQPAVHDTVRDQTNSSLSRQTSHPQHTKIPVATSHKRDDDLRNDLKSTASSPPSNGTFNLAKNRGEQRRRPFEKPKRDIFPQSPKSSEQPVKRRNNSNHAPSTGYPPVDRMVSSRQLLLDGAQPLPSESREILQRSRKHQPPSFRHLERDRPPTKDAGW